MQIELVQRFITACSITTKAEGKLTVWKLQNFSVTQILREIKVGWSRVWKYAILTLLEAENYDFYEILQCLKVEIYQLYKFQSS